MPARSLPNLGLQAFFDLGEDGWNDEMDNNMLRLSVLVQAGAISSVSILPSSPNDGDVYIVNESASSNPNTIAVRENGVWVFLNPQRGWLIFNRSSNQFVYFNGTVWETLATSTSNLPPSQRWELNFTPLYNEPPASGYATLDTRNNRPVLDFNDTTAETAIWSSKLPDIYSGSGLLIEIFFTMTTATTGNVLWEATLERMNLNSYDIDNTNFATPVLSEAVDVTTANSGTLFRASVLLIAGTQTNEIEAGELFRIRIRRVAESDTALGDAELISVYVREPTAAPTVNSGVAILGTPNATGVAVNSPTTDFYIGKYLIAPYNMTINRVAFLTATNTSGSTYRPFVYDFVSGALLSNGAQVTGAVNGYNEALLATPVTLTKGDQVFLGLNVTGSPIGNMREGAGLNIFASNGGSNVPANTIPGGLNFFSGSNGYSIWGVGNQAGSIPEAPIDGGFYVRRDADWAPFPSPYATVTTVSDTIYDLNSTDVGKYIRFTASTLKALNVRTNTTHALPENGEWYIRNVGADNVVVTPAVGVTVNAPFNGTLLIPPGGTVTLKRVETDIFDLLGQTVVV